MDKRYEVRRHNLRKLIDELADGVDAKFAERYGYTRSRIGQFLSKEYNDGKSIGDRAARALEKAVGIEELSLDRQEKAIPLVNWPFTITYEQYISMTDSDREELDFMMSFKYQKYKS